MSWFIVAAKLPTFELIVTLCAPWYDILWDLYIWISNLVKQTEDSLAASLFAF